MSSFRFSETFLFEEKKWFPSLQKKSISEGIFAERSARKMPSELRVFKGEVRRGCFLQKTPPPEKSSPITTASHARMPWCRGVGTVVAAIIASLELSESASVLATISPLDRRRSWSDHLRVTARKFSMKVSKFAVSK